jgi:hypothetical protein
MADIYNFNNSNNEEEHCCKYCDLAKDYASMIKYAETDEQLFELVREVISIAGDFTLIDYLISQNESNDNLIDYLVNGNYEEDE